MVDQAVSDEDVSSGTVSTQVETTTTISSGTNWIMIPFLVLSLVALILFIFLIVSFVIGRKNNDSNNIRNTRGEVVSPRKEEQSDDIEVPTTVTSPEEENEKSGKIQQLVFIASSLAGFIALILSIIVLTSCSIFDFKNPYNSEQLKSMGLWSMELGFYNGYHQNKCHSYDYFLVNEISSFAYADFPVKLARAAGILATVIGGISTLAFVLLQTSARNAKLLTIFLIIAMILQVTTLFSLSQSEICNPRESAGKCVMSNESFFGILACVYWFLSAFGISISGVLLFA